MKDMNLDRFIPHHTDTARDFFKRLRKLRAIDRIKAQPFFRLRSNFYMGAKWSPETIRAFHAMECAKLEINRICGMDPAAPDGDRTALWLTPDRTGRLVSTSPPWAVKP